ncbi:MAG: hypothetical protein ABJC62_12340 [Frankiaceae bacterium]|jgi:hypothetical protein
MLTTRYCSGCRDECAFERPPCADDHGGDCPEWICVECGFAVLVGDVLPDPVVVQSNAA